MQTSRNKMHADSITFSVLHKGHFTSNVHITTNPMSTTILAFYIYSKASLTSRSLCSQNSVASNACNTRTATWIKNESQMNCNRLTQSLNVNIQAPNRADKDSRAQEIWSQILREFLKCVTPTTLSVLNRSTKTTTNSYDKDSHAQHQELAA